MLIGIIESFCRDSGYDMRDYSGRGMFGRTCVGIVCYNPLGVLRDLCVEIVLRASNTDEAAQLMLSLGNPATDSMGMGSILYFPNIDM